MQQNSQVQETPASPELENTLRTYEAAVACNDVDSIAALLDETFVQTYPTGKVANKAEHLNALRSMAARILSTAQTDRQLVCYSGFAVLVAGTRLVFSIAGREHTMQVRATQVWREAPSGWSCVAIHSSFVEES